MELHIRQALPEETGRVCAFYRDVIDRMQDAEYSPAWQKDVYPSDDYLAELIGRGEMYIGLEGEHIAAAMAVNRACNESYADAPWQVSASAEEISVIHLLCVHPRCARRGFAVQLVRKAIALAQDSGSKCLRLDVLAGNLPALRLYERMGFCRIAAQQMYYEDTGWTEFILYEYAL